jgi:hypothetical protein
MLIFWVKKYYKEKQNLCLAVRGTEENHYVTIAETRTKDLLNIKLER